tara:strand:- start:141 stop:245 length:105 start_codon:yes stop_codon:yes gene_type:complete
VGSEKEYDDLINKSTDDNILIDDKLEDETIKNKS